MAHLSRPWAFIVISLFSLAVYADDLTPVSTTLPKQSSIAQTLSLSGSLTAEKRALLSPRVDGLVAEVLVDAGSEVKKGQVLLKLDPAISRQPVSYTHLTLPTTPYV